MNKRSILIICALFLMGVSIYLVKNTKQSHNEPDIHYHAGFVVFDNDKKVDFSDIKYMSIKPCAVHEDEDEQLSDEELQHEKAHLHDGVGDVVHSHVAGAKWGDLFTNVSYPMDYSKVTAFVNREEVKNAMNYPIKAYDSLVIFVGDVDSNLLQQAVTVEHIKNSESASEDCGK